MKKITFTFFLLISIDAYALPDCPGMDVLIWNNCFGTYTWRDGTKYVGEYKDNKRHGQGTYTYASGDKYVGNFKDDVRHGQGTFTFAASGNKYVGNFKDNKRHGQGTFTFVDGTRDAGFYMNDEYVPDMCEDMGLSVNSSGYENCINRLIEAVLD